MTRQHFETYHFTFINSIAVLLFFDTVNAVTIGVHEPNMAYHIIFDMRNKTNVTSMNSLHFRSTWDGVRFAHVLHVCVVFCESLYVSPFFFRSLYYLFIFDLRLLINPSLCPNSSCPTVLVVLITLIVILRLTWIHTKHTIACETVFKIESMENNSS